MRVHLMKPTAVAGAEIHYTARWEGNVVHERLWRQLNGETTDVKFDRQKVMWSERAAQSHVSGVIRVLGKDFKMVEPPLPVEQSQ